MSTRETRKRLDEARLTLLEASQAQLLLRIRNLTSSDDFDVDDLLTLAQRVVGNDREIHRLLMQRDKP